MQLVPRVSADRVKVRHLLGYNKGSGGIDAALDREARQLGKVSVGVGCQLPLFAREIGLFGIGPAAKPSSIRRSPA
jgi:hypothetical protein